MSLSLSLVLFLYPR